MADLFVQLMARSAAAAAVVGASPLEMSAAVSYVLSRLVLHHVDSAARGPLPQALVLDSPLASKKYRDGSRFVVSQRKLVAAFEAANGGAPWPFDSPHFTSALSELVATRVQRSRQLLEKLHQELLLIRHAQSDAPIQT